MGLTTKIRLTKKQNEALRLLDDKQKDLILLLGGSGSGKSFVEVYKIIRDALRYKAPCLIARDKLIDLTTGVIDQIVPVILQLIAEENGQERWDKWDHRRVEVRRLVGQTNQTHVRNRRLCKVRWSVET